MTNPTALRILASGAEATYDVTTGKVLFILTKADLEAEELDGLEEGPTCSICDGLGHGYPGGPPCPIEDRGYGGEPFWAL